MSLDLRHDPDCNCFYCWETKGRDKPPVLEETDPQPESNQEGRKIAKPCPFCGRRAAVSSALTDTMIDLARCDVPTCAGSRWSKLDAWNQRAAPSVPDATAANKTDLMACIPMPEGLDFRNGGQQCDMLNGPCACGAWHHVGDLPWRIFNQLKAPVMGNPITDLGQPEPSKAGEVETQKDVPYDYAPWKPPFHYDSQGGMIVDSEDHLIVDVRGWGFLTGRGHAALALGKEKAEEIQDRLGEHVTKLLNLTSVGRGTAANSSPGKPICPACGKGEESDHCHCIPFHPVEMDESVPAPAPPLFALWKCRDRQ